MMKQAPKIDGRTAQDIIRDIERKARIYTPEWKYEPEVMDGGGAIAEIFAQMFGETLDRLNRVPYKHYLEFLNLLGTSVQSITPAGGIAEFIVTEGAPKNVLIKKGTQLFYDVQDEEAQTDSNRIIFETLSDFYAVPARLKAVVNVDPRRDLIEKIDFAQSPALFFQPTAEKNIQRHRFAVASNDVFSLIHPAVIIIRLENTSLSYRNLEMLERLADPGFARWSFFDGEKQQDFTEVYIKDGQLYLSKENGFPIQRTRLGDGDESEEEDRYWICCDMQAGINTEEIIMNKILIGSASLAEEKKGGLIRPEFLYANDAVLDPENGGYCFGSQLLPYDCFYIASAEVFSKRGALINIELALKTVVRQIGVEPQGPVYDFNKKYIVEKSAQQMPQPDKIAVAKVVWEYWNGLGWANLKVEGDLNIFADPEGKKRFSFTCPDDISPSLQNSLESYWIRARIVEVENQFSLYARMYLPYVESVALHFDYSSALQPADLVFSEHNCRNNFYRPAKGLLPMTVFQPLPEKAFAVYLVFDSPPAGYPVNLYFKIEGQARGNRLLNFEYFASSPGSEGEWRDLRVNDLTSGLTEEGLVSIYSPPDYQKHCCFGEEGYFLRITDRNLSYAEQRGVFPLVSAILLNTVEIVQKQTVKNEMYQAEIYESNKVISLANRPILECACWVNELSDLPKSEQDLLLQEKPGLIDVHYDSSGQISAFWVKWQQVDNFNDSQADDRHFVLDRYNGRIFFGNGLRGAIPSAGETANIRVDYSFGGGKRGNIPARSIGGVISSLPYIESATNPEMTCGGSDRHNIGTLEKVGPQKLKHRDRAVTAADYENIVLGNFPEIKAVKCIPHYNRHGEPAKGYVTVVVMPFDIQNRRYTLRICRKIEHYLMSRISCELLQGDRFAVVPAVVLKVNATVTVSLDDYDYAAETEKAIREALTAYLNPESKNAYFSIGEVPVTAAFFELLKRLPHVSSVDEVLLEASYYDGNKIKIVPLDGQFNLKYGIVVSGEHTVKIR